MSDRTEERLARLMGSTTATPDLTPTLLYCRLLPEPPAATACAGCPIGCGALAPTVLAALKLGTVERKAFAARWWCHNHPSRPCRGMVAALSAPEEAALDTR